MGAISEKVGIDINVKADTSDAVSAMNGLNAEVKNTINNTEKLGSSGNIIDTVALNKAIENLETLADRYNKLPEDVKDAFNYIGDKWAELNDELINLKDESSDLGNILSAGFKVDSINDYLSDVKALMNIYERYGKEQGSVTNNTAPVKNTQTSGIKGDGLTKLDKVLSGIDVNEYSSKLDGINEIVNRLKTISEGLGSLRDTNLSRILNPIINSIKNIEKISNLDIKDINVDMIQRSLGQLYGLSNSLNSLNINADKSKEISLYVKNISKIVESVNNITSYNTLNLDFMNQLVKDINNIDQGIKNISVDESQEKIKSISSYLNSILKIIDNLSKISSLNSDDISNTFTNIDKLVDKINNIDVDASKIEALANATELINRLGNQGQGGGSNNSDNIVDVLKGLGGDALRNVSKQGGDVVNVIEKFANVLGLSATQLLALTASIGVFIKFIKLLKDKTNEMINTIKDVNIKAFGVFSDTINYFGKSLNNIIGIIDNGVNKLLELASVGAEVEKAFFQISAYLGGDVADNLRTFSEKISSSPNTMLQGLVNITAAIGSMGNADKEFLDNMSQALTVMGRDLGILSGDIEKAYQDLGNTIARGYVTRGSTLYNLFTKNEINEIRELNSEYERGIYVLNRFSRIHNLFNNYINTGAGQLDLLKSQYKELINNIGIIALQVAQPLIKVFNSVLKLVNSVLGSIIKLFNIEVDKGTSSVVEQIGNSIEETGDKAKDASKKVASFDDVIQIEDKSSKNLTNAELGGFDYSGLLNVADAEKGMTALDILIEKIKKKIDELFNLFKIGDFDTIGRIIGDILRALLAYVNVAFDNINDIVSNGIKKLGYIIMGFFKNEDLFRYAGKTLAKGINIIIDWVNKLLKALDFKQIGKSITIGWNGFWDDIGSNSDEIGQTLKNLIIAPIQFVQGWLEEGGLDHFVEDIKNIIGSFISEMLRPVDFGGDRDAIDETVDTIYELINNIIGNLEKLVNTLKDEDTKKFINKLVNKLVSGFKANSGDWGASLYNIVNTILDTMIMLLDNNEGAFQDGISQFLENLHLGELLMKFLNIKFRLWWNTSLVNLKVLISSAGGAIVDSLRSVLELIAALVVWWFTSADYTISNWFKGILESISMWIVNGLNSIAPTLMSGLNDILNGLKSWWDGVVSWWKNTVKFPDIKVPSFLTDGFKNVLMPNAGWVIPKLFASGGIVTSATNAIIGEAGKEAVLPLESNTQWMDKLASRIGNKISDGGNNISIDMSGLNKNVYTRSELYDLADVVVRSLQVYGVNIAVS